MDRDPLMAEMEDLVHAAVDLRKRFPKRRIPEFEQRLALLTEDMRAFPKHETARDRKLLDKAFTYLAMLSMSTL